MNRIEWKEFYSALRRSGRTQTIKVNERLFAVGYPGVAEVEGRGILFSLYRTSRDYSAPLRRGILQEARNYRRLLEAVEVFKPGA
ncbi:hypothetical protein [Roseibium sp. RKSG952]|uniref:hypothetical protein n=1 Tax=Roseibium sp. RKSG952 TaxID=2529384 RepID=UPI0012BC31E2|nr:hypothetical protein [Roseibium sp. RKSG952]MTH94694.1 hypothetical protein [Roseibium sp. RKSG952]